MTDHTPNLEQMDVIAWALWRERRPYKAFNPAEPNHVEAMTLYRRGAAAVVAAFRDSGLTVIALPEANEADDDGSEWWVKRDSVVAEDGGVSLFGGNEVMPPENAHKLGAALIAASLTAQGDNP